MTESLPLLLALAAVGAAAFFAWGAMQAQALAGGDAAVEVAAFLLCRSGQSGQGAEAGQGQQAQSGCACVHGVLSVL